MTEAAVDAFLPLAGAVVLLVLAAVGVFRERTLQRGPDRAIGLGAVDLLIGLGLAVCGFVFAAAALSGFDREEPIPLWTRVAMVLVGQVVYQGPVAAYFWLRAARVSGGLRRVGIVSSRPWRDAAVAAGGLIIGLPVVYGVLAAGMIVRREMGAEVDQVAHELLRVLQGPGDTAAKAALIFSAVAVAPLLEETIFRGLLQSTLSEMLGRGWRWGAVLIASAIFASIHYPGVPAHAIPGLFALSVILGWTYERTGSLWVPILMHAAFNGLNVGIALLQAAAEEGPIVV